jgi:hypothetical protein
MLQGFKDPDFLAVRQTEMGSSEENDSPFAERLKREEAIAEAGGNMSTTSSCSDLGGGEDPRDQCENLSGQFDSASFDGGMDTLSVQQGKEDSKQSSSSKSDSCLNSSSASESGPKSAASEMTINPAASFKNLDDITAKYRPLSKHTLREGKQDIFTTWICHCCNWCVGHC